jgi:hypothetical protein
MSDSDAGGFPKLSAPARRALARAGYSRLEQLADAPERDIARLHGMGPTGVEALRLALAERGLSFREGGP